MAIGRKNAITNTGGSLEVSSVVAGEAIRDNAAVGVVLDGAVGKIFEVSASYHSTSFIGFSVGAYSIGDTVRISSIRGSTVSVIVENGDALNIGESVFISDTKGEVTQTAPIVSGNVLVQVGVSSSTDKILLITDFRVHT